QLADHEVGRLQGHPARQVRAGGAPEMGVHAAEQRVVVEHLLEVRDDPFPVHGVPGEAAAELVVDPAVGHGRAAVGGHLQGALTQDRPVLHRALDAWGRPDTEVLRWAGVNAWWTLQLADLPAPDALDEAILDAVGEDAPSAYEGVAALPFDPVRRLSTAVVRRPGRLGLHTMVVKGAVEAVIERCALAEDERARLLALAAREAHGGLRLLAVATAERPARSRAFTTADERGLTLLGFVALRDALAPTAADALEVFADRGVAVKILTGDHPGTAARACRDLGLDPGAVLCADTIEGVTDDELADLARRT
ncbi:hypothetical protein EAO74_37110, partial [Streptomyces sp. gb1(2016)]